MVKNGRMDNSPHHTMRGPRPSLFILYAKCHLEEIWYEGRKESLHLLNTAYSTNCESNMSTGEFRVSLLFCEKACWKKFAPSSEIHLWRNPWILKLQYARNREVEPRRKDLKPQATNFWISKVRRIRSFLSLPVSKSKISPSWTRWWWM